MSSIIKVDTIQNQSGANIISESSNTITVGASGDTITVPSGATLGGAGTVDLSSATVTLNDSMKNTPAFSVKLSANQSISDDVLTRVAFDTKNFDTDNAFDTSTYLFTVPSGKAGKYSFTFLNFVDDIDANDYTINYLEKNGTQLDSSINQFTSSLSTQNVPVQSTVVEDCAEGDEIEVVCKITGAGTQVLRSANTIFTGYRLIGV